MIRDRMAAPNKGLKVPVLLSLALLIAGTATANLDVEFKDSQKTQAFINTAFPLDFNVSASGSTDSSNLQNPEFEAEFEGTDITVSGSLDNCESITDKEIITPDITPGSYTLNLEVNCEHSNGTEVTGSEDLDITVNKTHRAEVTQNPAGDLSVKEIRENGLEFNVEYWNGYDKKRPQADKFYLNIYRNGQKIHSNKKWFEGVRKKDSVQLSLKTEKIPDLKTGKYRFDLMLKTDSMDDPLHIKGLKVTKNLVFSGRVKSPSGKGVQTKFDLGPYSFKTEENGRYKKRIEPGTYEMKLKFPRTTLNLEGVEVREGYKGGITYDYYSLSQDLNVTGLDAVNLVGIAFGYPVKNASITTEYDFGNINWRELKVFECRNWNLGKGCHADWSVVDSEKVEIVPWSGRASFPVNATEFDTGEESQKILINAYVIGRNQPMRLKNFEISSQKVYMNKEFKVQGRIESSSGDPVKKANVKIIISGQPGDKTFKTTTDNRGRFSLDIKIPKTGDYSLKIKAEKDPYSSLEKSSENGIKVVKKKSLGIEAPSSFEVAAGERKILNATVKNTGQTDIENIEVSASINKIRTSITNKNVFNSLSPGESSELKINVTVPKDFCSNGCDSYPSIDLKVEGSSEGENVKKSSSVTLVVSKSSSVSGQKKSSETDSSFSLPKVEPTGEFLSGSPGINQVLAGLMVLVLLAAVVIKKKKSSVRTPRRGIV